ncbi:hypothetical protein ABE65_000965 [Fictibacillus phosphorivorans]|uniref:Uncharacterized protein n=1 Tax=Fictibacillus phosphorivorans TaxID=1221500 RepID=A0A160IHV3_9BACL|nr:hypothetical protein [Fictibacillus phosphorivorans]ANC75508.1 hypothetical protein ABE65_000965 [Fictibacillus phosphorivorans]
MVSLYIILYVILALICGYCIYQISQQMIKNQFSLLFSTSVVLVILSTIASFVGWEFPKAFTNGITIFSTIIAISELALYTDMSLDKRIKLSNRIRYFGLVLFFAGLLFFDQIRNSLSKNDFSPLEVLGFALFLLITTKIEKEDNAIVS